MEAVQALPGAGLDQLEWVPFVEPVGSGVEVAVNAVGIGWGDVQQMVGTYVGGPVDAFVPCHEFAGTVVIGDRSWAVGERVMGLLPTSGALADRVRVAGHLLQRTPDGLDDVVAAGAPSALFTAYAAVHEVARVAEGESVLVSAASGGVGRAAVRLARRAGAEVVVGVVGSTAKAEGLAGEVDLACTYDQLDRVLASLPRGGVDVALESVGGPVFDTCVRRLNRGGRLVSFGAASATSPRPLPLSRMWHRGLTVSGFHLVDWMTSDSARYRAMTIAAVSQLSDDLIDIAAVFPRESVATAFEAVRARAAGRVVINVNPTSNERNDP